MDFDLLILVDNILSQWEESGLVPGPYILYDGRTADLMPMVSLGTTPGDAIVGSTHTPRIVNSLANLPTIIQTSVMYATALFPGGESSLLPHHIPQAGCSQIGELTVCIFIAFQKDFFPDDFTNQAMKDQEAKAKKQDVQNKQLEANAAERKKTQEEDRKMLKLLKDSETLLQEYRDEGMPNEDLPFLQQKWLRGKAQEQGLMRAYNAMREAMTKAQPGETEVEEADEVDVKPGSSRNSNLTHADTKQLSPLGEAHKVQMAGQSDAKGPSNQGKQSLHKGTRGKKSKRKRPQAVWEAPRNAPAYPQIEIPYTNLAIRPNQGMDSSSGSSDSVTVQKQIQQEIVSGDSDSKRGQLESHGEEGNERTAVDLFERKDMYKAPEIKVDSPPRKNPGDGASSAATRSPRSKGKAKADKQEHTEVKNDDKRAIRESSPHKSPMPKRKGRERTD